MTLEYAQRRARPDPLQRETDEDLDRYPFFLDFEQYWCRDVAEAFGSTDRHVARRAVEIVGELNSTDPVAPRDDPRSRAGVYDPQRTYPRHGSWPEQENHAFYLAVHALLTVGAELAAGTAAYQDPESPTDSYSDWLAQFLPKRADGRWLADRRDPPPSPAPEQPLVRHEPKTSWPWSLRRDDFDAAAGAGGEWVTVGAHIDTAEGDLSDDTLIESALVPHKTARALLIAAQTSCRGPAAFTLPTIDHEYDRPADYPFDLTAWLDRSTHHQGIDVHDERAGGIEFPPIRPGHDIAGRFGLEPDEDQRLWFQGGTVVFRSRVWGNMRSIQSDRKTGTRGDRLEVHHEFLQQMLHELDRTLVVQVRLRRDHRRLLRASRGER